MGVHKDEFLGGHRRAGWKMIYAGLAFVALMGIVAIVIFKTRPPNVGVVKKRTLPAHHGVFTAVLSPVDTVTAREIIRSITADIGADSAYTKMVVGSTTIYKQCTSLADYQRVLLEGLTTGRMETLKKQAVLLSHVAGEVRSDTMRTNLYLVGEFRQGDPAEIRSRMNGAMEAVATRSRLFGDVSVVLFGQPQSSEALATLTGIVQKQQLAFEERRTAPITAK